MANIATLTDPFVSPTREFYQNPYETFARLREEAPVFWSDKANNWIITRYQDARDILGDLHFEKGVRSMKVLDMMAKLFPDADFLGYRGKAMLNQNPPDHTRLRSLVNKAFTPSMINQMRSHIESIANDLIDKVEKKGEMDFVADFSFPLPATVIAEMLGIPVKDRDRFKSWSHDITSVLEPSPRLMNIAKTTKAYQELINYLKPLVAERRAKRQEDLISALVAAEEEGNKLTETELLANTVLLLIAGHETTTNLIGNGLLALLRNPGQMQMLKEKTELMPGAVLEFLRYDSPVQIVRRIADGDLEVGGQKIVSGQTIVIALGSANRDPAMFENPDELNVTRANANKHLAFGHGIHHCLGSTLAETEGQIALGAVLRRLPNIRLKTDKLEYKEPFSLRGLKSMPVSF
ncbi:MAG TPA: cytochrome P450 [Candidatus Obscuribacterales bacterium]